MPADQHLDHIGYASVLLVRRDSNALFDAGVDAKIQGGGLGFRHVVKSNTKY